MSVPGLTPITQKTSLPSSRGKPCQEIEAGMTVEIEVGEIRNGVGRSVR